MRRFHNILVVFDNEEQTRPVLDRAVSLSIRNQARLKVMDVFAEGPGVVREMLQGWLPREFPEKMLAERASRLEAFVAPARESGVELTVKVLQGTPFFEIIREVMRGGHDLLMKGADVVPGWRQMLASSTDMHLLRKCPAPVWIMKRDLPDNHMRIMAAVDPDPEDPLETELNVEIMDLATSLAAAEESELHIVHTWVLYGETMMRGPRFDLTDRDVEALAAQARAEHEANLNELLGQYHLDRLDHHVHLLKGDAGQLIPEFARRHRIDLIVMGTTARSGMAGQLIGNTAEDILHQVKCSVLTVKPASFVTPINLDE